jgi:hypothetical protein
MPERLRLQGGGFEVRLKDWEFGVGVDAADLVLRSPVRSFSIPIAAQLERSMCACMTRARRRCTRGFQVRCL